MIGLAAAVVVAGLHYIHADGYGPVRVGMTVPQAERALGVPLVAADDSGPADGCWHLKAAEGHDGLHLMIQNGRVTRASLWDAGTEIRTPKGVTVGDPEETVVRRYGPRLQRSPHAYAGPQASYLTYWTEFGRRGVRFETDDNRRVTAIHGGDETIRLIEGCS